MDKCIIRFDREVVKRLHILNRADNPDMFMEYINSLVKNHPSAQKNKYYYLFNYF